MKVFMIMCLLKMKVLKIFGSLNLNKWYETWFLFTSEVILAVSCPCSCLDCFIMVVDLKEEKIKNAYGAIGYYFLLCSRGSVGE